MDLFWVVCWPCVALPWLECCSAGPYSVHPATGSSSQRKPLVFSTLSKVVFHVLCALTSVISQVQVVTVKMLIPFFLFHLSGCCGKAHGCWLSQTLTYAVNYFHVEWNFTGSRHYVARPLIYAFSSLFLNGISISFLNPEVFLPATATAVWEMFQFLELFLLEE